jgi:hypothetical protein
LLLPTILGALLDEREYVGQNNIKSFLEHEGLFQPLKLTFSFHPNFIPNLKKMKIFIPGVKIFQHIYPFLNPNAMSFSKSAFIPFV